MDAISIVLIDDHPLMIKALSTLLKEAGPFEVVGLGTTAADLIGFCERTHPQVAIVDPNMSEDVYKAMADAIKVSPATKIVAFTSATGIDSAIRALDAGASGYVLKRSSTSELIDAILSVRSGETYIAQSFSGKIIAALQNASLRRTAAEAILLSVREREILRLLMSGQTNKEIAIATGVSEKTVKHYMSILMQKLQARSRLQLVIEAQKYSDGRPATVN
jgi:DNA-binding NarL/FixJ family response regulator